MEGPHQHEMFLADADATAAIGARLARVLPPRAVVHLHGNLGAGKSTLARALLRALGVSGTIRSPTYTLVEHYALAGGGTALHLDGDIRLWLVEWPERGRGALPSADLDIQLAVEGQGRHCRLLPRTPGGKAWLERMAPD